MINIILGDAKLGISSTDGVMTNFTTPYEVYLTKSQPHTLIIPNAPNKTGERLKSRWRELINLEGQVVYVSTSIDDDLGINGDMDTSLRVKRHTYSEQEVIHYVNLTLLKGVWGYLGFNVIRGKY